MKHPFHRFIKDEAYFQGSHTAEIRIMNEIANNIGSLLYIIYFAFKGRRNYYGLLFF